MRGAPLHSTISLSPWGLQTEYPEMHLVKDLGIAFKAIVEIDHELGEYKNIPWYKAKREETKRQVADLQRRAAFYKRICVLSCFNRLLKLISEFWAVLRSDLINACMN